MARIVRPMQDRNTSDPSASRGMGLAYQYRAKIGMRIRSMRLDANMTQRELGDLLGVGETSISALESGRSSVSPERYEDLRRIFSLKPAEWGRFLLRYTDPWLFVMLFGE